MANIITRILSALVVCLPNTACFGLTTPDMHGPLQRNYDQFEKENTIINQVKCELKQGVETALSEYKERGAGKGYGADWLKTWAAKITFKFTAKETGDLSPAFTYSNVHGVFNLAAGAHANSDATRTETLGLTWSVPELRADAATLPCKNVGSYQIHSDLKISNWLVRKAGLARIPGNIEHSKLESPFDVFNYEATFVSTFSAGINPSWSFNRYTVNEGTSLLNASRSRTDDVTITMGPAEKDEFGGYHLSEDAEDVRRAALFGQAIRGVR